MFKVLEAMNLATNLWLKGDISTTDDPTAEQSGIQANRKFLYTKYYVNFTSAYIAAFSFDLLCPIFIL